MPDHADRLDTPDYSPAELRMARRFVALQRATFQAHIDYAERVTTTTVSTFRGDVGPLTPEPDVPDA